MPKKEKFIGKLSNWLDENLLFSLSSFLLIFIPLYPKWPLMDIIPGYIVRIRLEDFLVVFTLLVWFIQVARKKIKVFPNPLIIPIGIYLAIGLLSGISAIFVTKTVPFQLIHIGKLSLHYFRRIEYFSLFFVLYSAVRNLKQVRRLVFLFGATLIILSIYGFGQKYFSWPVYSTMNREFAKGWRLVLTEYARVPSTFAGHYDLAAYLAFFLTFFASLIFFVKSKGQKIFFLLVFVLSFFLLILTASRTSFIAYLIGVTVVVFLLSLRKTKRFFWAASRWLMVVSFSLFVMFFYGDLSERFANFLKLDMIRDYLLNDLVKEGIFGIKEDDLKYVQLDQDLSLVYSRSDVPPEIVDKNLGKLPGDVYEDIPDYVGTESAEATRPGSMILVDGKYMLASEAGGLATSGAVVKVPRNYSDTAFVVGLSSAIRFDALWPMAIKGFLSNPLLGSGYSTLNKFKVSDFTEAESTDNDYLRTLGETGLLGFIAFFGIIGLVLKMSITRLKKIKDPFSYALVVGIIGGIIALLVNAAYIDVFEASKIAFTFWALIGILLVVLKLSSLKND